MTRVKIIEEKDKLEVTIAPNRSAIDIAICSLFLILTVIYFVFISWGVKELDLPRYLLLFDLVLLFILTRCIRSFYEREKLIITKDQITVQRRFLGMIRKKSVFNLDKVLELSYVGIEEKTDKIFNINPIPIINKGDKTSISHLIDSGTISIKTEDIDFRVGKNLLMDEACRVVEKTKVFLSKKFDRRLN